MKEYWTIKNKKSGTWWCRGDYFTSQKHTRGSYTCRVHALEAMISFINDFPDLEKDYVLVHVTVKTKPRGAKVGTWAWACEHMLAGKEVTRLNNGVTVKFKMLLDRYDRWSIHTFASERWTIACVSECFMRAHDWKVVP